MQSKFFFAIATTVAIALGAMGCAEERDSINRVQPDALAKSFFVGADFTGIQDDPEFYRRGTIVGLSYGGGQDGLFTSMDSQALSRIRWEITEDKLNARLSYERISGTDGQGTQYNGVQLKPANDGQIVASYKITSHFDIKREYNEQTGEELNVVTENTTDRPWVEREYFRVDWSTNLVTDAYDFDMLALLGIGGAVEYESLAYTVLDPSNPDAPHFVADEGYFDITNKVFAKPVDVDLSGIGLDSAKVPACMFPAAIVRGGSYPWGNCNPTELTIRESYRKVVDTDYEPMDFDGVRFQILGAFNFDYRRGYARNYGMLDREWNRFIGRYNIWDQSHYYANPHALKGADPSVDERGPIPCATTATTETCPTCNGDPNNDPNRDLSNAQGNIGPNGTADECEAAGSGSRCDIYTQKCTLPYRERTTRTIPWFIAGDTSLFDATNEAVIEWDLALKTAVQVARLVECRKTGGATCESDFPMWNGQQDDNDEAIRISNDVDACRRANGWTAQECNDLATTETTAVANERGTLADPGTYNIGKVVSMAPMIVLCHNPVVASDHSACGKVDTVARAGDIRYNLVTNVPGPETSSPWGVMVDATDPLTGEKVAGSMNVWTAVTDQAAQALVDQVKYVNGEISTSEITNGDYVRDWVAAAKLSGAGRSSPLIPQAELTRRLAGGTNLDPKTFAALTATPPTQAMSAAMNTATASALDVQMRNDVASPGQAKVEATLSLGRGTDIETQLVNGPMLQLAGAPTGTSLLGAGGDRLSPLALNNPLAWQRVRQLRENALAARGACVIDEAPEPTSLPGMADALARKFPVPAAESSADRQTRYGRMLDYVRRKYHHSVIAHEMGHSIGLRHNFVSSAAPLFYRPQYWQLRTQNARMVTPCTDAVSDGSTCVGPRYWDPVTDDEQSQLISMWMQSTVMDYPGDTSQDMIGLGITDFASARFFYGDNVSVYKAESYKAGTPIGAGISQTTDWFGGLFGVKYGIGRAGGGAVDDFHYSQLQANYNVLAGCYKAEVSTTPPANWNESVNGVWDTLLDGNVVSMSDASGSQTKVATKCRQQPVDYVPYKQLRYPTAPEISGGSYFGGPSVDPATSALRVPYAFATDYWADLSNVSVMRHDNGADPYEQVQFLVTTQEDRHIFDNYRRGRSTFSIIGAVDRSFERYNIKLQGISTGLGFLASIYKDFSVSQGFSFDTLWPYIVSSTAKDNMIASTMAFDHFVRELSRPEAGAHYFKPPVFQDPVLHSANDPDDGGLTGTPPLVVPNGATGYFRDVGFGGHPLENALATTNGDFDVEYFDNAGSYYDKINTGILLALSEDRFVSQSRRDFYDARFRAVGMADLFPDGFRRVIANSLVGDRSILAPRVVADAQGNPLLDSLAPSGSDPAATLYPARPLGWPSFWPSQGPQTCFATDGRDLCTSFSGDTSFSADAPTTTVAVDPQIGWEAQKFLIVWTVALIKANEKTSWMDMMRLWKLGQNSSPDITPRVEWQDPQSGEIYFARDIGTECLFGDPANNCAGGQIVQKGIAARVLQYANQLTAKGYALDTTNNPACVTGCTEPQPAGFNAYGRAMVARQPDGTAIVKSDPAVVDATKIDPVSGRVNVTQPPDCDQNVNPACTALKVDQNHSAYELQSYKSVPDYLWEAENVYGYFGPPGTRGIY